MAEQRLGDRIARGRNILVVRIDSGDAYERIEEEFHKWDDYNTDLLRRIFSSSEMAEEYSYWGIITVGPTSFPERVEELQQSVKRKLRRLESILERLPLFTSQQSTNSDSSSPTLRSGGTRKVFVVHGHNNELKETVARYLSQLNLVPVILHEQAHAGRTLIDKFEVNSDACFAVVLLTPDDVGAKSPVEAVDELKNRARQNVIFEWGFFVAKYGRRKVCALVAESVERPSDLDGVGYVPLDENGAWKMLLARELKAGNVEIDMNLAV